MTAATTLSPEETREFVRLARKLQNGATDATFAIVDDQPVCFAIPDVDDWPMIDMSEDTPRTRRLRHILETEEFEHIGVTEIEVPD